MKKNLLFRSIALIALFSIIFTSFAQTNFGIEDFETGDFSAFEWQFGGNADWQISDADPYEGTFSAQSGLIFDNQTSSLSLEYEVYSPENISFWFKVSSESNYDYLRFYIDGNEIDSWAGELPWQEFSTFVDVGIHTFTWEYEKDISVSTGQDACWIDFITFPPAELEALFVADTTVICENDIVYFTDLSIGPVTEWYWVFEGATPSTSNDQNPVVGYSEPGSWDVFLEVGDGVETATLFMQGYIQVGETPTQANTPTGITLLCASWGNSSYSVAPMPGITEYDWAVNPPDAATFSGGGTNVTAIWDANFLGEAEITVSGINYCGIGTYSEPLVVTRYLPDVNLMVPAFVALSTPPFELTGGTPSGGEYSGPGVNNGIFDPAAAGIGEHVVTYTYTDLNFCTGTAEDLLTVTEFTGAETYNFEEEFVIYPNPNQGQFILNVPKGLNHDVSMKIYNAVGQVAGTYNNLSVGKNKITLKNSQTGIFYLQILNGKEITTEKVFVR